MDLNRISLLGNVSQDPEQRTITGGSTVTKLSIATGYNWKDAKTGEQKEKVNFHTVIGWNKLGNTMQKYLKKGDRVLIEGRVDNRSYEKDGQTRYVTDVVANRLIMLGGKKSTAATDEPVEEMSSEEAPF